MWLDRDLISDIKMNQRDILRNRDFFWQCQLSWDERSKQTGCGNTTAKLELFSLEVSFSLNVCNIQCPWMNARNINAFLLYLSEDTCPLSCMLSGWNLYKCPRTWSYIYSAVEIHNKQNVKKIVCHSFFLISLWQWKFSSTLYFKRIFHKIFLVARMWDIIQSGKSSLILL